MALQGNTKASITTVLMYGTRTSARCVSLQHRSLTLQNAALELPAHVMLLRCIAMRDQPDQFSFSGTIAC